MAMVLVRLNGGPKNGKYVKYATPLPERIVMASIANEGKLSLHYDDYQRLTNTTDYYWVDPKTGRSQL